VPERNLTFGQSHQFRLGRLGSERLRSRQRTPAGNFTDYCNLLRLVQSLNVRAVHRRLSGGAGGHSAIDRHLDAHYAAITLTDRIWHPYSLGRERILDASR